MRRASAEVTIRTDDKYEGVEEFSLELFFASPRTGFFVKPNIATVTIVETTSEYILCRGSDGFSRGVCTMMHWYLKMTCFITFDDLSSHSYPSTF